MLFQPSWSQVELISRIISKEGQKEFDNFIQQTKELLYSDVLSALSSVAKESSLALGLGSSLSPSQRQQGVLLA